MEKVFYFSDNDQCDLWDKMWTSRTVDQELEACEIESPPRDLFVTYIPKGGKIIDAGCGFGKWVVYLHRRGYDILGIDSNDLAISKLRQFDPTLQVERGEILATGYPDHSFDAYISMGVVEHFEDGPQAPLKEAYRILKPGGLIFVSVPTVNILRQVIRRPLRNAIKRSLTLPSFLNHVAKRHCPLRPDSSDRPVAAGRKTSCRQFAEYRYTKSELEAFLQQAGFTIIQTVPHDFYGSRDHAVGLVLDFPFLGVRGASNFRLNLFGKIISSTLNRVSPWVACSSVLCVARAKKP